MPYIPSRLTIPPAEDRNRLDPHIFALIDKMKRVTNYESIQGLYSLTERLAQEIRDIADGYHYDGAWAGELNYCLHRIFLRMLPEMRYWIMALNTGWLHRVAREFSERKPSAIRARHTIDLYIPFEKPIAFKHITEWVLAHTASLVAPDDSQDTQDWISGVFIHIDAEFYRRITALYEEVQILKSGDVPEYEAILSALEKQYQELLEKRHTK